MQYPVPQFTDVEDKIIGSLTLRQFGIVFAAGIVIFLAYSATKSVLVLVFFFVLIGVPALAIAFAKINGRPLYKMFPFVFRFLTSPRYLVFHKEAPGTNEVMPMGNAPAEATAPAPRREVTEDRLREVNRLLQQKAREERELIKKL